METSAFNAEAPTEPAGETVGCRRQLGGIIRLILYDFIKSLSHFFVPKKRQLLCKGDFDGQSKPPPKFISNSIRASAPSLRGLSFFAEK